MQLGDVCTKQCVISTIGVLLAASGLIFAIFWLDIFNYILLKEMALRPGSHSYNNWKNPPLALHLDIYLYNWTNPHDFLIPGTKPILVQKGPYRFKEKRDKVDIIWHRKNSSVSYRTKSLYHFDEVNSVGSLDEMITTINVVALSASAKAKNWNFLKQKSVSVGLAMYAQEISVTKSARELLFEGYSDDMVDIAKEFPIFGDDVEVPFDRVGWFYQRNNSADLTGYFNVFTGEKDIKRIGEMHTWNFKKETGIYESHCGKINGSAGEFYPLHLSTNSTISLFTPDMCRTINFDYTDTVNIQGIEGYKFSGTPRSVDNGTKYPENSCYCSGNCAPSGVMNISACRFGSPVYMSYPHFYNADPYYINQVEGLNPVKEEHEFYMVLEPTTGIALEVAARFQANLLIEPVPNIGLFQSVPTIYFPVIWFEQKVTIDDAIASDLKSLFRIPTMGHICSGVMFSIGLIMIFWFPIDKLIRRKPKELKDDRIKQTSNTVEFAEKLPEGSPLLKKTTLDNVTFIGSSIYSIENPFECTKGPFFNHSFKIGSFFYGYFIQISFKLIHLEISFAVKALNGL